MHKPAENLGSVAEGPLLSDEDTIHRWGMAQHHK